MRDDDKEGTRDSGSDQVERWRHGHLIAHTKALEVERFAIKLVMRVPAPLKPIAEQLILSAASVPANLAEGHGRSGCDRMQNWRIACRSDVIKRDRLSGSSSASLRSLHSLRFSDWVCVDLRYLRFSGTRHQCSSV
jgi:hypothetical protein